jgi:opacity protein-like surface antigen
MKRTFLILSATALVLVMGNSLTWAQGMYFSGNLGAVWVEDSDITWFDGIRDEAEFDTGVAATGAIGYDLGTGLRTELEIGYRFNDVDRQFPGGIGGDVDSFSVMGNALFDFLPGRQISPFIGAGIGVANVEFDVDYWGEDDDTVFAYQIMTGVSLPVGYNMNLDFQYRYFATEDPDCDYFEAEYSTHSVMGGLRINF